MRKLVLSLFAVAIVAQSLFATVDNDYPERNTINPPYAIMRGIVNLGTFWLEYPRCLVYDYDRMSPMGIFLFPFTGTFYGLARVFLSVGDIALLGFTGPSGYTEDFIREYVWQMPWNAYAGASKPKQEGAKEDPVDYDKLEKVNINSLL
ncbi:hypothetical protein J6T93_02310 [bacterium]|nr:hypothetical protein [bacterium]